VAAGDFVFLIQAEKDGSFDPHIRINHSIAVFHDNVKKFDGSRTNVNIRFVSVCRVVKRKLSLGNDKAATPQISGRPAILGGWHCTDVICPMPLCFGDYNIAQLVAVTIVLIGHASSVKNWLGLVPDNKLKPAPSPEGAGLFLFFWYPGWAYFTLSSEMPRASATPLP
jgi:hypothetical protein